MTPDARSIPDLTDALLSEDEVDFLAEQGWLAAEVDDEVRHPVPESSGEAPTRHSLARIRDCHACRRLDVPEPGDVRLGLVRP